MISVVVPVHNEERSIALLYEELQAALEPLGETWEAVYVDDGSTDDPSAHSRSPPRGQRVWCDCAATSAGRGAASSRRPSDLVVTIDGDLRTILP